MAPFINVIHKVEKKFDIKAEKFACRHPYVSFAAMFIGMPVFVLTAVCLGSMTLMLPISWMFGWF